MKCAFSFLVFFLILVFNKSQNGAVSKFMPRNLKPTKITTTTTTNTYTGTVYKGPPCPFNTTLVQVPWHMNYRFPLDICLCSTNTFCHGPYCVVARNSTKMAFIRSCQDCSCQPRCSLQQKNCIQYEKEKEHNADPTIAHDPHLVNNAVKASFPNGIFSILYIYIYIYIYI